MKGISIEFYNINKAVAYFIQFYNINLALDYFIELFNKILLNNMSDIQRLL